MVVDVTAAANLTIGTGDGTPLPSYSLNYNSEIPMKNDFKNSFSYGQLYTWNSALNENKFSLDRLQREGMIGVRIGNVNISSANDTKKMGYFGIGTDMGYTGQLTIATPFLESGFQDFSGDYLKKEYEERKKKALDEKIKALKKDKTLSKDIKKAKIKKLKDDLTILTRKTYHNQTPYQKNLNKASTYLRFNHKNGYNTTIDFIGPAWLQNGIHNTIKDFKFEYEHKNIQGWVGKNF